MVGTVIEDINLDKDEIYELILNYFGDVDMTKYKENGIHSMYICKVHSYLRKNFRYLIATITQDNAQKGAITKLSRLKWVAIQTRTLDEHIPCIEISYEIKKSRPYNTSITRQNKNNKMSNYITLQFPNLVISLLHNTDSINEYPDRGTLVAAIETYRTILSFK